MFGRLFGSTARPEPRPEPRPRREAVIEGRIMRARLHAIESRMNMLAQRERELRGRERDES